jgi:hypothetical protein
VTGFLARGLASADGCAYPWFVTTSVVVLGAGFGGLELSTRLSEQLEDHVEITMPAPSEAAILLDEHLRERGVRDDVRIQVVIPFGTPIPPSPATSEAILARFAEGAARVVADHLIARIRGASAPPGYDGTGSCYIEFGDHEVGRVDVDFFSMPGHPTGTFTAPLAETATEKADYASSRRARWFGP